MSKWGVAVGVPIGGLLAMCVSATGRALLHTIASFLYENASSIMTITGMTYEILFVSLVLCICAHNAGR
jgi:hypothetical protein